MSRYFQLWRFNWGSWGLLALLLFTAMQSSVFAADDTDPDKEEKPKELPFRCSAWCAFRELRYDPPPETKLKKTDPVVLENTRPESVGWSGFGRRGQWATIVVELKNSTEKSTYKGTCSVNLNPLRATDHGDPYVTNYMQAFEVGPQTEKQYSFSVLCPEDGFPASIPVNISANNGFSTTRNIHLIDLTESDFVVVISESSGSFRYLAPKQQSSVNENSDDEDRTNQPRRVAVVEPADLPSRWYDLMLANLIILDGPPREQLSDAQWDALKSYVKSGGHLLITAGNDPSRLKGPIEDLAGITVRDMQEISSLDETVPKYVPVREDWRLPLVDATVSPKGNPDVRHNKKTNFVEMSTRYYAAGSVTFLPFSLSDKILMSWPGRVDIPLRILKNGSERTLFLHELASDDAPMGTIAIGEDKYSAPATLAGFRHNLDESFSKDTPVKMKSRPTVLAFLLFYLLCAVPGNYLLFGWFRRREVAWLAVPLWAATFSFIAYTVGYMGETGNLTVNEVSVLEAGPGQDVGIAHTFLGLYAPRRDDYRIDFPAREQAAAGHLINVGNVEARNLDTPELYIVDSDTGMSIERLQVKQRSTRKLEIVHRAQLNAGGLEVKFKPQQGSSTAFDIDVQNNTGRNLYNPVLVYQHQAVRLTAENSEMLEAGGKFSASGVPNWMDADKAFFGNLGFGTAHGQHAAHRSQCLSDYMRGRMDNYTGGVVCAWMDGALLPVKVGPEGTTPEKPGNLEGLTLLLTPIPVHRTINGYTGGKLSVRYSNDFDASTGKGSWKSNPARTAHMESGEIDNTTNGTYSCETFLELQVPENAAALHQDGEQLRLNFNVGVSQKGNNATFLYNGEVSVSVRKNIGGGKFGWSDITESTPGVMINGLSPAKPWKMPELNFSLADFQNRSTTGTIVLRVVVKNVQYRYQNSGSYPWYAQQGSPLELRNVVLKLAGRQLESGK